MPDELISASQILPDQFFEGFKRINPDVAEKNKSQIMTLAQKLIDDGAGTLELPATGENMMGWLAIQPSHQSQPSHQRFLNRMRSAVTPIGYDGRTEPELVGDFVASFLEERGRMAPMQAQAMGKLVTKTEPKTVWQTLCSCPLMFI